MSCNCYCFQLLAGGFVNTVYRVSLVGKEEELVVRIFGDGKTDLIGANMEVVAMVAAHRGGCGAKVMGMFTNGIVYAYTPGIVLDIKHVQDQHIQE